VSPELEQIIDEYLSRMDKALVGMPAGRRDELMSEIHQHIVDAQTAESAPNLASLRTVLDRLGDPEDLAVEAMENEGRTKVRPKRARSSAWNSMSRRSRSLIATAGVFIIAIAVTLGALSLGGTAKSSNGVLVPNLIGESTAKAAAQLQRSGLVLHIVRVPGVENGFEAGLIFSESSGPGRRVPKGSTVVVHVATPRH
jgi:uncharacterized membrane protein